MYMYFNRGSTVGRTVSMQNNDCYIFSRGRFCDTIILYVFCTAQYMKHKHLHSFCSPHIFSSSLSQNKVLIPNFASSIFRATEFKCCDWMCISMYWYVLWGWSIDKCGCLVVVSVWTWKLSHDFFIFFGKSISRWAESLAKCYCNVLHFVKPKKLWWS